MTKKFKIVLSCITVLTLLFALLLPCSAVISDLSDTLVVDRQYGSASSDYSNYKMYNNQEYSQGETTESQVSFAYRDIIPNYYWEDFNISSPSGLPIAEGGRTYQFALYNFYNYLYHEQDGIFYLKGFNRSIVWCVYTDGTSSSRVYNNASFVAGTSTTIYSSLQFQIKPDKPVKTIRVQIEFDYADYGIDKVTSADDPSDYIFTLGCNDFKIAREEVFPTADSGAIDDYHEAEEDALNKAQDGITEMNNVFEIFGNAITPGKDNYNGILFFGNLMRDLTHRIPDFSDIVWISLGLGLCMVIIGGVTSVVVAGSNREHKLALARERVRVGKAKAAERERQRINKKARSYTSRSRKGV